MFLFFLSCSDFGLFRPASEYGPEDAILSVSDTELDLGISCLQTPTEVLVTNLGKGPLKIEQVLLKDGLWTFDTLSENPWNPEDVPVVLYEQGSLRIPLLSGIGSSNLVVKSTDPTAPELTIPLNAEANSPPVVQILSPENNEHLSTQEHIFVGKLSDDMDPASDLLMMWNSNIDGIFGQTAADLQGTTEALWLNYHTTGEHMIILSATDSCGASSEGRIYICQEEGFAQANFHSESLLLQGSAQWDDGREALVLTQGPEQLGSAVLVHQSVESNNVQVELSFSFENSDSGQGFALFALDQDEEISGGGEGCLGYGASESCVPTGEQLNGWVLEVDLAQDPWDPTDAPHIAFSPNGSHEDPMFWTEISGVENNGAHSLKLWVEHSEIVVELDEQIVLTESFEQHLFDAYIGFSATSTSGGSQVVIDHIAVTQPSCED